MSYISFRVVAKLPDGMWEDETFNECERRAQKFLYNPPEDVLLKILESEISEKIFQAYSEWCLEKFNSHSDIKKHLDEVRDWLEFYQGREIEWLYLG